MASCGHAMQAAGGSIFWGGLKGEKCPVGEGHFDFISKDWEVRCIKAQSLAGTCVGRSLICRPNCQGHISSWARSTWPPRHTAAEEGCQLLSGCASSHLVKSSFSKPPLWER